ncbi:uncharacterized protein LOC106012510 [Aplysia californica]|uniref:Uncharacterized protein LOC106012510 n=1 Tax=Aplysia californica TaxID=6500 RepID=A0ABM1A5A0_APLCA|nr:uncharacterized protein LOC106012510 [Aplysia californica]
MPSDLGGASQDDDSVLQSTDSDVFLTDTAAENMACLNYVNVAIEEGMGAAAAPTIPTSSAAMPPLDAVLPPTHEVVAGPATNCAYLAFEPPRAARGNRQANYIVIDHQNPGQEGVGAPASLSNQSPTSPTSGVSLPESPSKKRESYAMIDFNRTAALSNATRPVTMEEEGGRKTRHNSTISDMP